MFEKEKDIKDITMLDYKHVLERLLRELIDKKIISEWYYNGAGYFWKYNEKDKRIVKKGEKQLKKMNKDEMNEIVNNKAEDKYRSEHVPSEAFIKSQQHNCKNCADGTCGNRGKDTIVYCCCYYEEPALPE